MIRIVRTAALTLGLAVAGAAALSLPAKADVNVVVNGQSVYLGSANGLVVKPKDAPSVYHMGDTGIFSDMALIAEIYAPKIGLVPIGDRFTMSGQMAALAVTRFFNFETVVPCHYGTFDVLDPDASHFVAAMKGHAAKVAVPRIGEVLQF